MSPNSEDEILRLSRENAALIKENNTLLRRMHRNSIIELWVRIVWIVALIGLPFAFYFYILEPYFEAFGASYEEFRSGIGELPGIKGFETLFLHDGVEVQE